MFGEKLDYLILRQIAHGRNIATEEEENLRAGQPSLQLYDDGYKRLLKYIERFDGRFPISPNLRYLDMGCGKGELAIGLAKLGCQHVTGVDFVPRNIAACKSYASQLGVGNAVQFICADMNSWVPLDKFDVLLSFAAFEHIDNPRHFLQKMADFMNPEGVAVLAFGPLFHSPFGDHMWDFFRMQIPWRGVLFSEQAVLRVRRECFRPTDAAERYQDIVGGLNLMRYSEFLNYIRETGWHVNYLSVNPHLKRLPPLHHVSNAFTRLPVVRDFFVHIVYVVLRRSALSIQHK